MITQENVKNYVQEVKEKFPKARILFINSTEKENKTTGEKFRSYYTKFNGALYGVRFDRRFNQEKFNDMIIAINEFDYDRCVINGYNTLVIYRALLSEELATIKDDVDEDIPF